MTTVLHVAVGLSLGLELLAAHLAGDFRGPVSASVHVLAGSTLRGKVTVACLAEVARSAVVEGTHVLVAGLLAAERAVAGLAVVLGIGRAAVPLRRADRRGPGVSVPVVGAGFPIVSGHADSDSEDGG